jgi:hypothetical protein
MNRETIYASLAGCAGFLVVAFGSYWYFSPTEPPGMTKVPGKDVPAKSASAIPAGINGPASVPVQPAATGNAFPAPAPISVAPTPGVAPTPSAAPTPTAYGSSMGTGPQTSHPSPAAQSPEDDEERPRSFRARNPSSQLKQYPISVRERRMRRRAESEDE